MKEDFKNLNIKSNILEIIEKEGFKRSTTIQFKTMPLIFSGSDIIATSPVSSGKTFSYILSLIQTLNLGSGLETIIIVPTKEHVKAVESSFKLFSKGNKDLKIQLLCPDNKSKKEKENFEKTDFLIITPKKLKELINEKIYDFSRVKTIVFDDVDVMFELGNFDEFNFILRNMPKKKQMVVFSTTISQEIYLKIRYWMKMPKRVAEV